jgi:hypothetical protein
VNVLWFKHSESSAEIDSLLGKLRESEMLAREAALRVLGLSDEDIHKLVSQTRSRPVLASFNDFQIHREKTPHQETPETSRSKPDPTESWTVNDDLYCRT